MYYLINPPSKLEKEGVRTIRWTGEESEARGGEACCRGYVVTKPCCRRLDPLLSSAPGDAHTLRAASPPRSLVAPPRGPSVPGSCHAPRQPHCRGAALPGGPPKAARQPDHRPCLLIPLQPFLPEAGKSVRRGQVTQSKCRAAAQPLGGGSHIWEGGNGVCPTCIPENCSSRRWFVKGKQRP